MYKVCSQQDWSLVGEEGSCSNAIGETQVKGDVVLVTLLKVLLTVTQVLVTVLPSPYDIPYY